MRRFLLDSNALNQLIYRLGPVYLRARQAQSSGAVLGTGIPVVAEILGGVEYSVSRSQNLPRVQRELKLLRLWPFDLRAAHEYATLYAELRRRGAPVQTIDLMIAAVSRTLPDRTTVSSDRDFSRIPGVRL